MAVLVRTKTVDLGSKISLIDAYDMEIIEKTGSYVIRDEQLTIVETCGSPSVPYILRGLREMGLEPEDVKYIILTHIHLDHAGGAGLLLQNCSNAKVVVHPKGARHLINPERLVEGARAVYGEQFDKLYDPVVPIPEEAVIIKEDGKTLTIGPSRTLQFFDTPGHANHHFCIHDPASNGIFTGDTAGVYYHQVKDEGVTMILPITSPNQFNPQATLDSLERIRELNVDRIYFGHFGMSEEPEKVFQQIKYWLPIFVEIGEETLAEGLGEDAVASRMLERVRRYLTERGIPSDHMVYPLLEIDLELAALGMVDYLRKKR